MIVPTLVAVMGPTASGKTDFAEALADATGFQLVNADAFQVYRNLDIGTAKSARRSEYLMIDVVDPWEPFGVGEWIRRLLPELEALFDADRGAIVVGGTLFYIRALFERYLGLKGPPDPGVREGLGARDLPELVAELQRRDPEAAASVDLQNRVRVQRALERLEAPPLEWDLPPYPRLKLLFDVPQDQLRSRIERRVDAMLEAGWLEEVEGLPAFGVSKDDPGMRAHGYRALWDVARGELSLAEARAGIVTEVAQYAKRQRTWLRREPNGVKMPEQDEGTALAYALACIGGT